MGKFLFTMKEFVSFLTDLQNIFFMSNIFFKDKIDASMCHNFNLIIFAIQK